MNRSTKMLALFTVLIVGSSVLGKGPSFSKGGFSKAPSRSAPSMNRGAFKSPNSSFGRSGRSSVRLPMKTPMSRPNVKQSIGGSRPSFSQQRFTPSKPRVSRPISPSNPIRNIKPGGTFRPSTPGRIPNYQSSKPRVTKPSLNRPNLARPNLSKPNLTKPNIRVPNFKPRKPGLQSGKPIPGKFSGIKKPVPGKVPPQLRPNSKLPNLSDRKPNLSDLGKNPGLEIGKPAKPRPIDLPGSANRPPNNAPPVDHDHEGDHDHDGNHNHNIAIGHLHWHKPICLPPIVRCPPPRVCPPCVLAICPQAEVIFVQPSTEQVLIEFLEEPSEPAFVIDLQVDTEASLEVDGLAEVPGALVLDVNGIGLPVEILGAEGNLVSIKVPSVGLSEAQLGKLYVLNTESQLVAAVDARLHPAAR